MNATTGPNSVEVWKARKHGFDVWPDLLRWASEGRGHSGIEEPDLQRLKWYGIFWRKPDKDRYMIRIRLTGGELTAAQARAIAFLAYESEHGLADVTTRGNIQIQGMRINSLPNTIATLEKSGLSTRQTGFDNVRTVTSNPLSGLDAEELIDTRGLAREITALFLGDRGFADLPRKFNIALNGRADSTPSDWTQDIAWLATRHETREIGFRLLVGGNQGAHPAAARPLPVFVSVNQVATVTRVLLEMFREMGSRTDGRMRVRFRYLVDRLGVEGLLDELERRLGFALARREEPPASPSREESFIGWLPQKQPGLWSAGVSVPLGRLTWQQLEWLSIIARELGDGTLRATTAQNIVLPNIPSAARLEAGYALGRHGLSCATDALAGNILACTGRQFCNQAQIETKGLAFQLMEELRRRRVEVFGIRMAMSGCPHSCAQHLTADIGLKGSRIRKGLAIVDAFDLYLGGGGGAQWSLAILYRKGVLFTQLPECLESIIAEFHECRKKRETFSEFWRRRLADKPSTGNTVEETSEWRCRNCGYVRAGKEPPGFCPCCAAVRSQFEAVADDDKKAAAETSVGDSQPRQLAS